MILCCGEALIDMIPTETRENGLAYAPHAGGAVFNTAVTLGRLGADVGFLSGLSNDMFGQILKGELEYSGVRSELAIRSNRPTTLAFVTLKDGQAQYSFYDENSAGRMISSEDMPNVPKTVKAMFFGGISLAVEPAAEAYADLLCQNAGERLIMLDPNIRPSFIPDPDRYRARLDRSIARTDILKLSDEDIDWILPGKDTMAMKVQTLLDRGPSVVLITRGSAGASAFRPGTAEISAPARKVVVADTVGAGDSFNGGFLAQLSKMGALEKPDIAKVSDATIATALNYAVAVAAITVSRHGANPPWAADLVE